jgi:cellulose synthase/poly-beta-1,6-N-acetylglucosamine synthase-like glycosyltransferase
MTLLIQIMAALALLYLAVELALYWMPLIAARWRPLRPLPVPTGEQPVFCIVSACRDGAACIPGLVRCMEAQPYPADKRRLFLVADHCTDDSAALARSLGMEVYERQDPAPAGKGNAVSDFLRHRLRHESFDGLIVLDIDARVDPDFLQRAAAYFATGTEVLSCATFAKNPDQTLLAHVGDVIQKLLRLHQRGRAALGLDAILYGSHGYALSRAALDRLRWRTTTGQVAEDMELRLRCGLAGLAVRYAPDLAVYNDVRGA